MIAQLFLKKWENFEFEKKIIFFFSKKNEQSYEKNKIKYKQSYEIKEKMNNLTK